MISENDMYWLTRLDHIRDAMPHLIAFGLMMGPVLFGIGLAAPWEKDQRIGRIAVLVFSSSLIISALAAFISLPFIPTTREMCAIKVVPLVANNEDVQALGADIPKLAREWMEELKPKRKPEKE